MTEAVVFFPAMSARVAVLPRSGDAGVFLRRGTLAALTLSFAAGTDRP